MYPRTVRNLPQVTSTENSMYLTEPFGSITGFCALIHTILYQLHVHICQNLNPNSYFNKPLFSAYRNSSVGACILAVTGVLYTKRYNKIDHRGLEAPAGWGDFESRSRWPIYKLIQDLANKEPHIKLSDARSIISQVTAFMSFHPGQTQRPYFLSQGMRSTYSKAVHNPLSCSANAGCHVTSQYE